MLLLWCGGVVFLVIRGRWWRRREGGCGSLPVEGAWGRRDDQLIWCGGSVREEGREKVV